jgi:formylglycine-generating enzyme required for sulfatase activity
MNEKLPELRMVPLEQQGIDTRQQEQLTNNSGRTTYTPIPPEMVRVNGGTFIMGCIDGRDKDCNATVKPAHEVTLSTYFMGKYEVTNAEFAVFLNDINDNPTRLNYPNEEEVEAHQWGLQKVASSGENRWAPAKGYDKHPVINVSWNWADAYCKWLSRQTGEKYHLPSEAEWEYAARGGQASAKNRFLFAGSDQIGEVAWYADNAKRTYPVGQKRPNQLDIYDMSGNVYEWCQDWYGAYTAGNQTNPGGPVSGRERVMRGGSFGMFEEMLYVGARAQNYPNLSNQNLGFRVARTP